MPLELLLRVGMGRLRVGMGRLVSRRFSGRREVRLSSWLQGALILSLWRTCPQALSDCLGCSMLYIWRPGEALDGLGDQVLWWANAPSAATFPSPISACAKRLADRFTAWAVLQSPALQPEYKQCRLRLDPGLILHFSHCLCIALHGFLQI